MSKHDLSIPVRTVGRHRWWWVPIKFEQLVWSWALWLRKLLIEYPSKMGYGLGEKADNQRRSFGHFPAMGRKWGQLR